MEKIRVEITVVVSEGSRYSHYDSVAVGREMIELVIDERTMGLLPWPQICAGLADAAHALYRAEVTKIAEDTST